MWQTIRYRRLQAVTIALLAALVTTCAVFAPLYSRAMQQAITRVELQQATVAGRGLQISAHSDTDSFGGTDAVSLPEVGDLAEVVPASVRRRFGAPVLSQSAETTFVPGGQVKASGSLLWRAHACDHLRLMQGRCPHAAGEIAVSSADVDALHLAVGQVVSVDAVAPDPSEPPPTVALSIVGVYRQLPSATWFGRLLTGHSGVSAGDVQEHDDWITGFATFHSTIPALRNPTVSADLPLDVAGVGIDELLQLSRAVDRLDRAFREQPSYSAYRLFTRLPAIATEVRHQREQTRTTVPLLMLQLGLLAVVVLWLVLGSATEQRRPETAVAVLRGRGRSGARALLLRELLPVVLVGVPVGAALALGLCWFARDAVLPGSAPFEVGATAVAAVVAVAAVLALTTLLAADRTTREPVERLLRRVPARRAGWTMGVAESLLLAASGSAVVAFVTGSLTGPVALVAPAVLALFVGVLLAHATAPLAAATGRRLLRRGRVGAGVSVLDAARTPAARRTVAIVTVASALLVFAVSAVLVGASNRSAAAEQVAGAPLTAEVTGTDLGAVRDVLRRVDPTGRLITPVVSAFPPADDTSQTMAVEPAGFQAVALFPGTSPDLSRLAPRSPAPILLRGDELAVTVATRQLDVTGASKKTVPPVRLDLDVLTRDGDGDVGSVALATLAPGAGTSSRASAPIPCTRGCRLIGISIDTSPGASVSGSVTLSALSAGASSVALGPVRSWTPLHTGGSTLTPSSSSADDLTVAIRTSGAQRATLPQAWLPTTLPAVVAGGRSSRLTTGLDREDRRIGVVGTLQRVPGGSRHTVLVDLDRATRATVPDATDRVAVWFAHDDPALYAKVASALRAQGLGLTDRTTLADVRRSFDESTAAWSLDLSVVVGGAAILLAVLVVVVLAATTSRSRVRDLAALRLAGLGRRSTRRIATLAQLPPLVVAVLAGAGCGALGARLTLPDVPLFASAPAVPTLDLGLPWVGIVAATVLAAAVLLVVGWCAGLAIARRADLQRVRETL